MHTDMETPHLVAVKVGPVRHLHAAGSSVMRHLHIVASSAARQARERAKDERGEGVISMAIAVLIIAFIGVAIWAVFAGVVEQTEGKIETQVNNIGS